MGIKKLLVGLKAKSAMKESESLQNPYVSGSEGRREWNDRYMNMTQAIRHWQVAFFIAIGLVVILAAIVAKIATESKVQPFVVETNQGMPYAVKPMPAISVTDQRLINFAINQFIINARTIVSDPQAEKTLLNKVYAFSANRTLNFLQDYYKNNNPIELASQYTVNVAIVNALPISKDTWQITWDETKQSTMNNTAF